MFYITLIYDFASVFIYTNNNNEQEKNTTVTNYKPLERMWARIGLLFILHEGIN